MKHANVLEHMEPEIADAIDFGVIALEKGPEREPSIGGARRTYETRPQVPVCLRKILGAADAELETFAAHEPDNEIPLTELWNSVWWPGTPLFLTFRAKARRFAPAIAIELVAGRGSPVEFRDSVLPLEPRGFVVGKNAPIRRVERTHARLFRGTRIVMSAEDGADLSDVEILSPRVGKYMPIAANGSLNASLFAGDGHAFDFPSANVGDLFSFELTNCGAAKRVRLRIEGRGFKQRAKKIEP